MAKQITDTQNALKNLGIEGVKIRSAGKTSIPSLQSPEVLKTMRERGAYKYIRYYPQTDTFRISTVYANQLSSKLTKQAALVSTLPETEYLRLQVDQRVAGNSEALVKYLERAYGGMFTKLDATQVQHFREQFINATINPKTLTNSNVVRLLQTEIFASEEYRKQKSSEKDEEDKRNPFSFEVLNHMTEVCSEKSIKGDARVEYFFGEVYPIILKDAHNPKIEIEPKMYTKSRPQTTRRGGRGRSALTLELLLSEASNTVIDITSMLKDGTKVRKSTQPVSNKNSAEIEYMIKGASHSNVIKFGSKLDKRESVRAVLTDYRQKFDTSSEVGRAIDKILDILTEGSRGQQEVYNAVSATTYFQ